MILTHTKLILITITKCLTIGTFCLTTACATKQLNPNYAQYINTINSLAALPQKPLVDLQFSPDGKIKSLQVTMPKTQPNIKQFKPYHHPIWHTINNSLPIIGTVSGILATGHSLKNIIHASSNNKSIANSYNTSSNNLDYKPNIIPTINNIESTNIQNTTTDSLNQTSNNTTDNSTENITDSLNQTSNNTTDNSTDNSVESISENYMKKP